MTMSVVSREGRPIDDVREEAEGPFDHGGQIVVDRVVAVVAVFALSIVVVRGGVVLRGGILRAAATSPPPPSGPGLAPAEFADLFGGQRPIQPERRGAHCPPSDARPSSDLPPPPSLTPPPFSRSDHPWSSDMSNDAELALSNIRRATSPSSSRRFMLAAATAFRHAQTARRARTQSMTTSTKGARPASSSLMMETGWLGRTSRSMKRSTRAELCSGSPLDKRMRDRLSPMQ